MQDTSPAASQRPDPVAGRDGEAVTWLEVDVDEPGDTPLIALIPLPDELPPDQPPPDEP
ncbi:hypothetical protein [Actinophytocola sp.]|jgi:hypothetical protein|uniref:hypothetical protein n=1 Tax=Actinophytocola sp. TaxID=1872138 RepID=UPI002EDB59D2